jgi:hypothetical protein
MFEYCSILTIKRVEWGFANETLRRALDKYIGRSLSRTYKIITRAFGK